MNARDCRIRWGLFLRVLTRDTESLSAAAFKCKYGIDVRDGRAARKRFRELADAGKGDDDEEVRALLDLFAAMRERNANWRRY